MNPLRRLLIDFGSLTLANFGSRVLLVAAAVITAYYVGPYYMGVLGIVMLVLNWGLYFHFGLLDGLLKVLPEERGRGNQARIDELRQIGYAASIILGSACCLILAGASRFPRNPDLRNGLLAAAAILLLQLMFRYFYISLVADGMFRRIGIVVFSGNFLRVVLALILVIVLPLHYKFYGPLAGLALGLVAQILAESTRQRPRVSFRLPRRDIAELFRVGWALTMYGLLLVIFFTADKLLVVKYLGLTGGGLYELGSRMRELIGFFLASFFTVILPRGLELYSRTGDRNSLLDLLHKPLAVNSHLYPVMMALIIFWVPPFIRSVLPQFAPGIPAMVVLAVGCFFLALSYVPAGMLVVLGQQKKSLYLLTGSITIYLVLVRLAILFRAELVWVAAAAVAAYFVYGTSILIYAHYQFDRRLNSLLRLSGHYLPGLYAVLLIFVLTRLAAAVLPETSDWLKAPAISLLFLALYSPILVRADRKSGIMTELLSIASRRLKPDRFQSLADRVD